MGRHTNTLTGVQISHGNIDALFAEIFNWVEQQRLC